MSILLAQRGAYLRDLGRPREALADTERALALREAAVRASPDDFNLHRAFAVQLHALADVQLALADCRAACHSSGGAMGIWRRIERPNEMSELDRTIELPQIRALEARSCRA